MKLPTAATTDSIRSMQVFATVFPTRDTITPLIFEIRSLV
jgi:hypothetical protein